MDRENKRWNVGEFPRTDLAIEMHEFHVESGKDDGIKVETYTSFGVEITKTSIYKGRGEKESGKRAGVYITADVGELYLKTSSQFESAVFAVSEIIKSLIPEGEGCVMVAGIGNDEIISDAIGPETASGVIATRHIKKMKEDVYNSLNLKETVVIQTDVLGNTGVESAEIVLALVEKIKPKCVIAVDSLAARRLSRLASTVQISDAGIMPGSGVANRRLELNEETIGVPVIAIGVPTVVDVFTLVRDLSSCVEEMPEEQNNFYVAPKESGRIIKESAKLLSSSINMALHGLTLTEMSELV